MMLYALVCRFFCGEEWARSGSSCYPFDVVVISYPVNKKTTATNGGLFAGSRATNSFSEGNWLQQSADTKYCPFSVAAVGPSLQELCKHLDKSRSANPVTSGCCQWR